MMACPMLNKGQWDMTSVGDYCIFGIQDKNVIKWSDPRPVEVGSRQGGLI